MNKFIFEPICDIHTENIRLNSRASLKSNPEVIIRPSECVMPKEFERVFERIYNLEVFPDDTWIITYPKCGTTWTQEMVWLLRNNLDYEKAKTVYLKERCPFLEAEGIVTRDENYKGPMSYTIQKVIDLQRPRCIKSHLPLELLPKALWTVKPKIIYVTRDPRDVAISYYHHYRLWNGYDGTLEDFTKAFLADRHVYSPFWSHILKFWTLEDKSHILLNNYEEMKKDLAAVIRKTAKFLKVDITDSGVEELKEHLTFQNMKKNDKVNFLEFAIEVKKETNIVDDDLEFIRKGESGGWMNIYSKDMIEEFDNWTTKNLSGSSYKEYPYSSK